MFWSLSIVLGFYMFIVQDLKIFQEFPGLGL